MTGEAHASGRAPFRVSMCQLAEWARLPTMRHAHFIAPAALSAIVAGAHIGRAQDSDTSRAFGYREFGARLTLAAISSDANATVVVSPLSAGLVLSLASGGARGTTATAMTKVLGTATLTTRALADRTAWMLRDAGRRSDVTLEIANGVWVDTSTTLVPEFTTLAKAYGAAPSRLALSSANAFATINRWVSSATHGKIDRLLGQPLDSTTRVFLANALYFKGKWLDQFDKSATTPRSFTPAAGARIMVPMMSRTGRYGYARRNGFQIVRLPYRGDRVAMYVVLPDSGASLERTAARLADEWPTTIARANVTDVHVLLPRFHVEQQRDLLPILGALGMGEAFDCDRADFSGLGRGRALCIGSATQRVYVDVGEEGTEAAAATGLAVVDTSAPPPPREFIVDRPFLFIIRDESWGADLLVGRVAHP